ncbi:hypothetical protein [Litorilituus sediminis]|uniref:Uncharacterized protein n=1 Tax=Litorilituus sediminis TaxID=718192 RepID=A0A4P6P666_9GAMM|nr:hypothetical protein [Litorilituus sediminis]QBG37196.1 hypothetical protein EMK97_16390 [Litorilituus sediminis]
MNKLAILAFSLLLFFSAMSWFLASGSLNDYLKSQASLQGQYYSGQKTNLESANFDANTGIATFKQISLTNLENYQDKYALKINQAKAQLLPQTQANLLTIEKITLDKVEVFIEQQNDKNNLSQLHERITEQLVSDFPKYYPALSAKQFALAHPELNAQLVTKPEQTNNRQETAAAIEARKAKHNAPKRGKKTNDIQINNIVINELVINSLIDNKHKQTHLANITLTELANKKPLDSTQLGGEILRLILQETITPLH